MPVDPRPDLVLCARCGWSDYRHIVKVDASNLEFSGPRPEEPVKVTITCPNCGHQATPVQRRERIYADIFTALRDADLTVPELVELRDALQAGDTTTAADLATAVPRAQNVIDAARKMSPGNWIALLAVIVTALIGTAGILVSHSDAVNARETQESTNAKRTSDLTDEDLRKLREKVKMQTDGSPASRDQSAHDDRHDK